MASVSLKQVLTRLKLRQLAGAKAFQLGVNYFEAGQVVSLTERDGRIAATVQGTDRYEVVLRAEGSEIISECTCPMGAEGAFCRHCVATGLAWLAHGADASRKKKAAGRAPVTTLDDARLWLAKQDRDKLMEIILARAAADPRLRDQRMRDAADGK